MKILSLLLCSAFIFAADVADLEISKNNQLKKIQEIKKEIKQLKYAYQVDKTLADRIDKKTKKLEIYLKEYQKTLNEINRQK